MAEQIVSPGVFQRETDQSFITPAPVEVGAAIVGPIIAAPNSTGAGVMNDWSVSR